MLADDKDGVFTPQPTPDYIARFNKIVKAVDERFDVRGSVLVSLVQSCLDNNGTIQDRTRTKFGECVAKGVFDFIEQRARETSE